MINVPTLNSELDIDKARAMLNILCPESDIFHFVTIEGEPYSKARPRFSKKGHVYATQKQKNNELNIGWKLKQHFKEPYLQNLSVGCIFFRSTKQRIDVDNMLKNVMDAANGIVYADDCQVTAKLGIVELDSSRPRTVIMIGTHKSTMVRNLDKRKKCAYCKEEFVVKEASHAEMRKFCSMECCSKMQRGKWKSIANCPCCKQDFKRLVAAQIYCGTVCRNRVISEAKKARGLKKVYLCRTCGSTVSRPEYIRCRKCWKNDFDKKKNE